MEHQWGKYDWELWLTVAGVVVVILLIAAGLDVRGAV